MSKQLVTVFGATGNQGGSVISAILDSPTLRAKYALRGVTRDPSKPAGQALAARGVEMVRGDMADAASIQHAVAGAYAVFGVTNFWELFDKDLEIAQGKNLADAVFAAGVRHFVWSSLPDTTAMTGGKLAHIDHFTGKAAIEAYIEAHKHASGTAATYFMPATFMSIIADGVQRGPDGALTWTLPMPPTTRIPMIEPRADSGKFVVGALEAGPAATDGVRLHAISQYLTPAEMVDVVAAAAGQPIAMREVSPEVYKSFLPPAVATDLVEMFEMIAEYGYYGPGDEGKQAADRFLLAGSSKTTFQQYVDSRKWNFA